MKYHTKKIFIQTLGLFFILLGVAGIFLPILQGILFLIIGLLLLSVYSEWARRQLDRMGSVHPKAAYWVARIERWVYRVFGPAD